MKRSILICFVLVWVYRAFTTLPSMVRFIDTLPISRALEAKIVVSTHDGFVRNGILEGPYYLIYRVEKK